MYLIDTLGFEEHMKNMRSQRGEAVPKAWYRRPYFYELFLTKEKIMRSGEAIEIPEFVLEPDYEFEIAARFTEDFQTASEKEAVDFVCTKMQFAIMNDFSARDHQRSDMELPLSVSASKGILPKSFGEWVPAKKLDFDENGVPNIKMQLGVNGTLRRVKVFDSIYFNSPDSGRPQCWSFAQVIAWLGARNRGFKKGWVLGSGTIGEGSIAELRPKYDWLKDGDEIFLFALPLGVLINKVKHIKS